MPLESYQKPEPALSSRLALNSCKARTFKIKMASIRLSSKGQKRFSLCHASGAEIETDAPLDNHGKGEAFSPTDLLAASLAACMLTILEIEMEKSGEKLAWAKAELKKSMQASPRKVAKVEIDIYLPKDLETKYQWTRWKDAMEHCPVALSLHPELVQMINYRFEGETLENG